MPGRTAVRVFATADEAAGFIVALWRALARAARGGRFTAALSGGRTPARLFDALAAGGAGLPWERSHLFQVDERCVPPDDARSNQRLIRQRLVEPLGLPAASLHAISTTGISPAQAAAQYERGLRAFFGPPPGMPRFDLVLLGIGDDGHTASLFPGAPGQEESARLVLSVEDPPVDPPRITMSLPLINAAANVVFFVSGGSKAAVMREILVNKNMNLPAARVEPAGGSRVYVLDRAAAGLYRASIRQGADDGC